MKIRVKILGYLQTITVEAALGIQELCKHRQRYLLQKTLYSKPRKEGSKWIKPKIITQMAYSHEGTANIPFSVRCPNICFIKF